MRGRREHVSRKHECARASRGVAASRMRKTMQVRARTEIVATFEKFSVAGLIKRTARR
jgi:hypothetical protein